MLNFLYVLPDLAIVFGFTVFWAGLVALLPALRKTFPALEPSLENTDFVLRIQGTLFTMTGFALAITLVQAQGNFRRVRSPGLDRGVASQHPRPVDDPLRRS